MAAGIQAVRYVSWSDIEGEEATSHQLAEILGPLPRDASFLALCRLNIVLGRARLDGPVVAQNVHNHLAENILDNSTLERMAARVPDVHSRPVFHRQQLLFLMKEVLRHAKGQEPSHAGSAEMLSRLGNASLMANDLLLPTAWREHLASIPNDAEHRLTLYRHLAAYWMAAFDLSNPQQPLMGITQSAAFIDLFERAFAKSATSGGVPVGEVFRAAAGVPLADVLDLTFYVLSHYVAGGIDTLLATPQAMEVHQKAGFRNIDYPVEGIEAYFDLMSATLAEYAASVAPRSTAGAVDAFEFRAFRAHPLLRIGEATMPVDLGFLVDKLGEGVFHAILNHLPKGDRNRFLVGWGNVFEAYVTESLRMVYPRGKAKFYPRARFETATEYEAFDGMIESGRILVAMEYKGGFLSEQIRLGHDADALFKALDKKYGTGQRAGLEQLVRKIGVLFNRDPSKRLTVPDFASDRIRVVYPVLVVQERALDAGFIGSILAAEFDEMLARLDLRPEIRVRPVSLLTVENLLELLPYVDADAMTLPGILDESIATVEARPMSTFQDATEHYRLTRHLQKRKNLWLQDDWDTLTTRMAQRFRDNPAT